MAERKKKGRKPTGPEPAPTGRRPNTVSMILVGVGILAVLLVAWNMVTSVSDRTARTVVELEDTSSQALVEKGAPARLGPDDAPLVVMDFSDYSCPACRQFAALTKPMIIDEFVDRGLVRLEYYDWPTGGFQHSVVAHRAARCAGDQDRYWDYHDLLFQRQDQWSRGSDPVGDLIDWAAEIGLDRSEFRSCLRSDAHVEAVSASQLLGRRIGVTGTPGIFLNARDGSPVRVGDEWANRSAMRDLLTENLERLGALEPGEDDSDTDGSDEGDSDANGEDA